MNNDRRKEISALEKELTVLKATAGSIKERVESIWDDEEEAKENLPQSLQDGEKGEAMDTNCQNLESAVEQIEDIESSVDEGLEYLAAAREGE